MKALESRLRRKARRLGYTLLKSRVRNPNWDNQGKYMLVNTYTNTVVWGERFDLKFDQIDGALDRLVKGPPTGPPPN